MSETENTEARTERVSIRVTQSEKAAFEAAVKKLPHRGLSDWGRSLMLAAVPDIPPRDTEPPCALCDHAKRDHQISGTGGPQCRVCPGDDERSWRHTYTPKEN